MKLTSAVRALNLSLLCLTCVLSGAMLTMLTRNAFADSGLCPGNIPFPRLDCSDPNMRHQTLIGPTCHKTGIYCCLYNKYQVFCGTVSQGFEEDLIIGTANQDCSADQKSCNSAP